MKSALTLDFIRGNRTSSMIIAFTVAISSFLLSMLSAIMYNFWADGAAQAAYEGVDWQAQLTGESLVTALFYSAVILLASIALLMIIRNAFSASMRSRIHQLGILATVGATHRQLRSMLLREAILLSAIPAAIGITLGIAGSAIFVESAIRLAERIAIDGAHEIRFRYSPWVMLECIALVTATVLLSAGLTAHKMAHIPALQAVTALPEDQLRKGIRSGLPTKVLGVEGELAINSMRLRRSSLRFASISLALAFLIFEAFLMFMTVSKTSVNATYYERYGTNWDMAINIENVSPDQLQDVVVELSHNGGHAIVDTYDHGTRIYALFGGRTSEDLRAEAIRVFEHYGIQGFTFVDMKSEKQRSEAIWNGYSAVVGGFCGLLALIGVAGIASQAIGFAYQRKREFARYRSIGMTSTGMYKMLIIEGTFTVLRPVLIALPFAIAVSLALAVLSRQPIMELASSFPYGAVLAYLVILISVVATAYAIGTHRILRCDLSDILKNDALV